jgi:hypothetical protein
MKKTTRTIEVTLEKTEVVSTWQRSTTIRRDESARHDNATENVLILHDYAESPEKEDEDKI